MRTTEGEGQGERVGERERERETERVREGERDRERGREGKTEKEREGGKDREKEAMRNREQTGGGRGVGWRAYNQKLDHSLFSFCLFHSLPVFVHLTLFFPLRPVHYISLCHVLDPCRR